MSVFSRWEGSPKVPFRILGLRALKTHLFEGRKAVFSVGVDFLLVSSQGRKKQNSTKTGLILEVEVVNITSPSVLELVKVSGRIFLSRVGYNHKDLATRHSFISSIDHETIEDVRTLDFPVVLRPSFVRFFESGWNMVKNITHGLCQVVIGAVIPSGGLIFRLPLPAIIGLLVFTTTSISFMTDISIWEIVTYLSPLVLPSVEFAASFFTGKRSQEWMAIWATTIVRAFYVACAHVENGSRGLMGKVYLILSQFQDCFYLVTWKRRRLRALPLIGI